MRKTYVSYLVSILALVTTYTRYRNALLLDNGTVEIASFRVPLGFLVGGGGGRPSVDSPGGAATLSRPSSWRWVERRVLLLEASSPGVTHVPNCRKVSPLFSNMDEDPLVLSPGSDTIYWAVNRVAGDCFVFVGGAVDLQHDLGDILCGCLQTSVAAWSVGGHRGSVPGIRAKSRWIDGGIIKLYDGLQHFYLLFKGVVLELNDSRLAL